MTKGRIAAARARYSL